MHADSVRPNFFIIQQSLVDLLYAPSLAGRARGLMGMIFPGKPGRVSVAANGADKSH